MTESRAWAVDPANPLPLYYQVYASLLQRIQGGEFPPGTFIPAERQLTEDYGVSRITIIKPSTNFHASITSSASRAAARLSCTPRSGLTGSAARLRSSVTCSITPTCFMF